MCVYARKCVCPKGQIGRDQWVHVCRPTSCLGSRNTPSNEGSDTNQFVEFWSLMWHRYADFSGHDATVPQNRIQILLLGPGLAVIHQYQTRGRTLTAKPLGRRNIWKTNEQKLSQVGISFVEFDVQRYLYRPGARGPSDPETYVGPKTLLLV